MIERDIAPCLRRLFARYPFVTVTGPRQSGKTTLCRQTFPDLAYVNLEAPDRREFAQDDPRGFLAHLGDGAILDEIQRVPDLLSYLQVIADDRGRNGLFVLTGSENLKLSESIGQSLAGRTGLLRLLPFSLEERERTGAGGALDDILYSGFYPRIYDRGIEPRQALSDYFETYVERDVRRLGEIRNVSGFRRFVRLCAGRVGQLTDLVALGADAGVSRTTVQNWLDLLERSYIAFRLPPFHANIRKRLVKTPKLYFYDVGLAACLIGIERASQVATHPLRGPLFENMIVVEVLKHRFNRGRSANLAFFRDSRGLECDLLFETGDGLGAIEIKAGATVAGDFLAPLEAVARAVPGIAVRAVLYGGADRQSRSGGEILPFDDLHGFLDRLDSGPALAELAKNRPPPPSPADIEVLDAVYRRYIRPTLDALSATLEEHAAPLFRKSRRDSSIGCGSSTTESPFLLDAGYWEMYKKDSIAKPGFALTDERPLIIAQRYSLSGYSSPGEADFSIAVSLVWTLKAEEFSRTATVNDTQLRKIDDRVRYSDLHARSARIDSSLAAVENAIGDEMEKLSRAL